MIDDCNINNLAGNQLSAVFHSRAIRRSVPPKFKELCMETPCCAFRRGTNMADVTSQKHLSLSFAIEMKIFTLEL